MLHNIVSSLSHCWFLRIRILFFNNNENNRHNASYSWQMIAINDTSQNLIFSLRYCFYLMNFEIKSGQVVRNMLFILLVIKIINIKERKIFCDDEKL